MITLRLLWIHIFAWGAVWLMSYWSGWEYLAAVLYLLVITLEADSLRGVEWGKRLLSSLAWQIPGFSMAFILLTGWDPGGIYNYAIFLLLFWMTPILPWLALLPPSDLAYPSYYYGLIGGAPLLALWIWTFSGKINPLAVFKHNKLGSAKDCV